ncbi:hypothetical protein [Microcoleus sp. herbarium12]|uniref:hypothetical protein n=1 Tax=Microcoleus sp. herbarium12 TaxID=3055437 RepID=UPI002FCEB597
MYFQIEPTAYIVEGHDLLITPFKTPIKTEFYDEDTDEEKDIQLGYILAHRFDLAYSPRRLVSFADDLDSDLFRVAEFFFMKKTNYQKIYGSRYLFYIDYIFIEPEFRGHGYALQALALFLELFARGEIVSCHPIPMKDLEGKYSKTKGQLIMRKYWSKLGLTYYSKKHNILWQDEWSMPQWLKSTIFKSFDDL